MAILVDVATDSVSLGSDFIGLNLAYHYTLSDAFLTSDSVSIEATYNTDLVEILDQVGIGMTLVKVSQDAVAAADSISVGFVLWRNVLEALAVTDNVALAGSYSVTNSDSYLVNDVIHTWNPTVDSVFQANLEGTANLSAVLVKKNNTTPEVLAPPPKTTSLPKTPGPFIDHNMINTNPRTS